MILFKKVNDLKAYVIGAKNKHRTIGFVPTMGALHKGHAALLQLARQQCDIVISSIFVNPAQFNDNTDYLRYPVKPADDILQLETAKADVLFLPAVDEIYPGGIRNLEHFNLQHLEHIFEGKFRPGHFQGVSQVMEILLSMIQPDLLFMGQKDYQQCLVVERLIALLHLPVELVIAPTVRESTGLAMSSRNLRLNEDEREKASAMYQTLRSIKNNYIDTPIDKLIDYSEKFLLREGFSKVDYVALAHARTLEPIRSFTNSDPVIALIAAYMKDVRLIDNMLLNTDGHIVQG